jgi:hypothetical protein
MMFFYLKFEALNEFDLLKELNASLLAVNRTIWSFYEDSYEEVYGISWFKTEFDSFYTFLMSYSPFYSNNTKYTIYLWDRQKLTDFVENILIDDSGSYQKFEKIISTLKNHVHKLHLPTQSIFSNQFDYESLANKKLRYFNLNFDNVSIEF